MKKLKKIKNIIRTSLDNKSEPKNKELSNVPILKSVPSKKNKFQNFDKLKILSSVIEINNKIINMNDKITSMIRSMF